MLECGLIAIDEKSLLNVLTAPEKKTLKRLVSFLWNSHRKAPFFVFLSIFFLVLAKVAALLFPLIYKHIVDHLGALPNAYTVVVLLIAGYGVVRFSSVLFSELRDVVFLRTEQRAIRQISLKVFEHLHALSMRFHLDRKTGELTRILERGGRAIESFFRYFVFNLFPTFLELILIASIVFALYPFVFGVIILTTLIAYVVFTFKVSAWRIQFMRGANASQNQMGQRAVDSLINFATVKYFGNEALEARRYDTALESYQSFAVKNKLSLSFLNTGQALILTSGIVGVMYFALSGVSKGVLSLGDFVLLYTYLMQAYMPLYILGFAYRELKQAFIDMEDLFGLLDIPCEIQERKNAKPLTFRGGKIEFRDVCFAYDNNQALLQDVSFVVAAGEKIAIVGTSGSGKSTLVSLMMRFFDPQKGVILIDDQPLKQATQASLRRVLGFAPQDIVLFNDTLFYNIQYGNLNASRDEVVEAAKKASLDPFIKNLPEGYETVVGERGLKLSGGEKQRVGLARIFLKKPQIYLFDEATSALDTRTERLVQKNLYACAQKATTFIIAHRLSTIVDVDRIFVMEQGRLMEQGTHQALLKAKGLYAKLWDKQQHKRED